MPTDKDSSLLDDAGKGFILIMDLVWPDETEPPLTSTIFSSDRYIFVSMFLSGSCFTHASIPALEDFLVNIKKSRICAAHFYSNEDAEVEVDSTSVSKNTSLSNLNRLAIYVKDNHKISEVRYSGSLNHLILDRVSQKNVDLVLSTYAGLLDRTEDLSLLSEESDHPADNILPTDQPSVLVYRPSVPVPVRGIHLNCKPGSCKTIRSCYELRDVTFKGDGGKLVLSSSPKDLSSMSSSPPTIVNVDGSGITSLRLDGLLMFPLLENVKLPNLRDLTLTTNYHNLGRSKISIYSKSESQLLALKELFSPVVNLEMDRVCWCAVYILPRGTLDRLESLTMNLISNNSRPLTSDLDEYRDLVIEPKIHLSSLKKLHVRVRTNNQDLELLRSAITAPALELLKVVTDSSRVSVLNSIARHFPHIQHLDISRAINHSRPYAINPAAALGDGIPELSSNVNITFQNLVSLKISQAYWESAFEDSETPNLQELVITQAKLGKEFRCRNMPSLTKLTIHGDTVPYPNDDYRESYRTLTISGSKSLKELTIRGMYRSLTFDDCSSLEVITAVCPLLYVSSNELLKNLKTISYTSANGRKPVHRSDLAGPGTVILIEDYDDANLFDLDNDPYSTRYFDLDF